MFKSVKSLHIHKLQLGIILSKETLLHYAVFTMILYVLLSHGLILHDRLCCDFARDLIKLDFFEAVISPKMIIYCLAFILDCRNTTFIQQLVIFKLLRLKIS